MAIHSSILAWRILWTEEAGGLYIVHGIAESDTTGRLSTQHKGKQSKFSDASSSPKPSSNHAD